MKTKTRTYKGYYVTSFALSQLGDAECTGISYSVYETRQGERAPNSRETWLDVQARALGQAANLIATVAKEESK